MKKKIISLLLLGALSMCSSFAYGTETNYDDPVIIKEVQEALDAAGFDCGPADGIAGQKTAEAISKYRSEHNLPSSSDIDNNLLSSLHILESEITSKDEHQTAQKPITLRGISWSSTKAEVDKALVAEGAETGNISNSISNLKSKSIISQEEYEAVYIVEGGGVTAYYFNLSLAGYTPSLLSVCFTYPIDKNQDIIASYDDAVMCSACYSFMANDFSDIHAIYEDLAQKLSGVYGPGSEETTTYQKTMIWKDSDGNIIALKTDNDESYIDLGYESGEATQMFKNVKSILDAKALAKENEEREANKDNIEGL